MFDQIALAREFFETLTEVDRAILAQVAAGGCPRCEGPLYRSDYERKPRGGLVAEAAETWGRRFSLCCGREGCRRRATPPSVRFLGRRVYVGAVVIVASVVASALAARAPTLGVPSRTTQRWLRWWRGAFTETTVFVSLSGRLVPALSREELPSSLLARYAGSADARIETLLLGLAPLTTGSVLDGSRFVRGLV